jgi:hypothetical protein
MSSELIKRVSFKKDGVYFASSSSNVTPKDYYSEKSRYHTELLNNEGMKAVIKKILWDFVTGGFRAVGNDEKVRIYEKVAYNVRNSKEYDEPYNIYWCWDDVERTWDEKNKAKDQIEEMLYHEYLKVTGKEF